MKVWFPWWFTLSETFSSLGIFSLIKIVFLLLPCGIKNNIFILWLHPHLQVSSSSLAGGKGGQEDGAQGWQMEGVRAGRTHDWAGYVSSLSHLLLCEMEHDVTLASSGLRWRANQQYLSGHLGHLARQGYSIVILNTSFPVFLGVNNLWIFRIEKLMWQII